MPLGYHVAVATYIIPALQFVDDFVLFWRCTCREQVVAMSGAQSRNEVALR